LAPGVELPYVALEHVESEGGKLLPGFEPEVKAAGTEVVFRRGDVLFGKLRPYLAKVLAADFDGCASGEFLVLRPGPQLRSRYLYYLCLSRSFLEWAEATSVGTKMPRTDWDGLSAFRLQLPAPERQGEIVDFLDRETARHDELIAGRKRQAALLQERLDRQVERLLLPGLDDSQRALPTDVPLPSEYPNSWRVVALGQVLRRITYGFTNPMPVEDDGPYMLTANDIKDGFIDFAAARRTSAEAFAGLLTEKSRPGTGDVLVTKDGSLGRVALFPGGKACINQSIALLRPNVDLVEPEFLAEVLRARPYQEAMLFEAGGSTIRHLYITRMARLRVAMPARNLQGKLLEEVRRIRGAVRRRGDAIEESSRLLAERRQGLITAAVTGQIDV
jgi:type I restriction enzyme S subunit